MTTQSVPAIRLRTFMYVPATVRTPRYLLVRLRALRYTGVRLRTFWYVRFAVTWDGAQHQQAV